MTRVRRIICFSLILALLTGPIALALTDTDASEEAIQAEAELYNVEAVEAEITTEADYLKAMLVAARDGSSAALVQGVEAEIARNLYIREQGLDIQETNFFETYEMPMALVVAIASHMVRLGIIEMDGDPLQSRIVASSKNLRVGPDRNYERIGSFPHGTIVTFLGRSVGGWLKVTDGELAGWGAAIHMAPFDGTTAPSWAVPGDGPIAPIVVPVDTPTDDDRFWLALAIQMEAGSDWICDEHQLWVGNVVINRRDHPTRFRNTIQGVVNQPGQYPWAARGVRGPISDRAWANADRLLAGERFMPPNVVYQAQFRQGDGTWDTFHCSVLNTTHFFGYIHPWWEE